MSDVAAKSLSERAMMWEERLVKLQSLCERQIREISEKQSPVHSIHSSPTVSERSEAGTGASPAVRQSLSIKIPKVTHGEATAVAKISDVTEPTIDQQNVTVSPIFTPASVDTATRRRTVTALKQQLFRATEAIGHSASPASTTSQRSPGFISEMSAISTHSVRTSVSVGTSMSSPLPPQPPPLPAAAPTVPVATPSKPNASPVKALAKSTVSVVRSIGPDIALPTLSSSAGPSKPRQPLLTATLATNGTVSALPKPPPVVTDMQIMASESAIISSQPLIVPSAVSLSSPFLLPDVIDAAIPSYVLGKMHAFASATAFEHTNADGSTASSLSFKRFTTLVRLGGAGFARDGFGKGNVIAIQLPNITMFPVTVMSAIALGAQAAIGSYEDCCVAGRYTHPSSKVKLRQLSAFYARLKPQVVIGTKGCLAVIASALSNAGVVAAVYCADVNPGEDADPTETLASPKKPDGKGTGMFSHPSISSITPLHALFSGGMEGFPDKVKLNVFNDPAVHFYMGEQELEDSLPSTSFPMFTHCSLVRTLSSCLSSSTVEAVATFHSRCGLDGSAVYQGARQLLTSDVLDAVERELQRQNELRYFSSRAMSSEEKPVTLLSSTLQADAVYASGQRVICTLPWETPFAFVWGLLLPLLSGAIVVCGPVPRQSSADCLITNASGLATAVANHPKVTQLVAERDSAPVGGLTLLPVPLCLVWCSLHPLLAPTHIAHVPAFHPQPSSTSIGCALAGVSCKLTHSSPTLLQSSLAMFVPHSCGEKGSTLQPMVSGECSISNRLFINAIGAVFDSPAGLQVDISSSPVLSSQRFSPSAGNSMGSVSIPLSRSLAMSGPAGQSINLTVSIKESGPNSSFITTVPVRTPMHRVYPHASSAASVGSAVSSRASSVSRARSGSIDSKYTAGNSEYSSVSNPRVREVSLSRRSSRATAAAPPVPPTVTVNKASHQRKVCERLSTPVAHKRSSKASMKPTVLPDTWPYN